MPEIVLKTIKIKSDPCSDAWRFANVNPPCFNKVKKVTEVSQMPCRVSSDAHEWNNEGPAVPAYNPVKPHKLDEQSSIFHRGEKTPWSFTAACTCGIVGIA
jgi:hypothetical protein